MNLLSLGAMPKWVVETINSLWMTLCKVAYYFVNILYQVFQTVANVNLFSEDVFEKLTGRMYVVIGLVMLFVFAYNLILTIINPEDKKSTSGMVNVVKETIISLVIVILLPLIFNYLFILQEHILSSNIIGTIVFGGVGNSSDVTENGNNCDAGDYDCSCNFDDFDFSLFSGQGNVDGEVIKQDLTSACNNYKLEPEYKRGANIIAPTILSAFFTPVGNDFEDCVSYLRTKSTSSPTPNLDTDTGKICTNYFYDVTYSKYTGSISSLTDDSVLVDGLIDGKMELHSFMAFGAGLLTLYIMFCYALEIGVRVAKLGFLQLISPIPVMLRVIPGQKEKIYAKWFDNIKNTYLDVFIRVAIIYFALFGVSLVPKIFTTIFNNIGYGDGNGLIKVVSIAIVILGILKFALDAPKLFIELFSLNGNFAVRSPRKQLEENKLAKGAIGAVGAGALGFATGIANAAQNIRQVKNDSNLTKKEKYLQYGRNAIGGVFGGATRFLSGARYGAVNSYTGNLNDMKNQILSANEESIAAREKHRATRERGANTLGHNIPIASGIVGGAQNIVENIGRGIGNLGEIITGGAVSQATLNASNNVSNVLKQIETKFTNGAIQGLLSAQGKLMDDFLQEKDIKINGITYHKDTDGQWHYADASGSHVSSHDDIKNLIKTIQDQQKANLFGEQFKKNREAFENSTKLLMNTLNQNMSYFTDSNKRTIFDKINENLKLTGSNQVKSIEALDGKFQELQNDGKWEDLYMLNDALSSAMKGINLANSTAEQARQIRNNNNNESKK